MVDKEYACANRSDYFAYRLRTQNDSIALKEFSQNQITSLAD
jgi:hypothetical protein